MERGKETNEEETVRKRRGEKTNQDKEMKQTAKISAGWKKSQQGGRETNPIRERGLLIHGSDATKRSSPEQRWEIQEVRQAYVTFTKAEAGTSEMKRPLVEEGMIS